MGAMTIMQFVVVSLFVGIVPPLFWLTVQILENKFWLFIGGLKAKKAANASAVSSDFKQLS